MRGPHRRLGWVSIALSVFNPTISCIGGWLELSLDWVWVEI